MNNAAFLPSHPFTIIIYKRGYICLHTIVCGFYTLNKRPSLHVIPKLDFPIKVWSVNIKTIGVPSIMKPLPIQHSNAKSYLNGITLIERLH